MTLKKITAYEINEQVLTGENALQEVKNYQKGLMFEKTFHDFIPTARKILGLPDVSNRYNTQIADASEKTVEDTELIDLIFDEVVNDIGNFEELIFNLGRICIEVPKLPELLKALSKYIEELPETL